VTLAYIGGEDFHHDPNAFFTLFEPRNPFPYMDQLNFANLA